MIRTTLLLLALLFAPLAMADQATVLRDGELRAEPFADASAVGSVRTNDRLEVLQRQGGWYQVRDAQQRHGWLRMSTLRLGEGVSARRADGQGTGQALQLLQTGRSGSSGTTVATGIRGLDANDVSRATPNHQAVQSMSQNQVQASTARSFSESAKLRPQPIAYLKERK